MSPGRHLPDDLLQFVQRCLRERKVYWTYHVNMRLAGRYISREEIFDAVDNYTIVEAYAEDMYLPSYLVLAMSPGEPFSRAVCRRRRRRQRESDHGVSSKYRRMGTGFENPERQIIMKCRVCGSTLHATTTDLPFKVGDQRIVILKNLPVLQCDACTEYVIADPVFARVEQLLAAVDISVELEIIQFAA